MQAEVIGLINTLTSQDSTYLLSILEVCGTYNDYTIFFQVVSEIILYSLEFIKEFVRSNVLKKSPDLHNTLSTIFNTFMYSFISSSLLVVPLMMWMMIWRVFLNVSIQLRFLNWVVLSISTLLIVFILQLLIILYYRMFSYYVVLDYQRINQFEQE